MSGAYYNEIEPFAAQWLRNLIAAGHIADGVVDERSMADVKAKDLDGFTQCHFFAGVGVWSHSLRRAGWSDDRPVWTGSAPCQPFSAAGAKGGAGDDRHLWPVWERLIAEHRPNVVFGEQVSAKGGRAWWDIVAGDLEKLDYAAGAIDSSAAGVGAPHIRQRLYWMGHSNSEPAQRWGTAGDVQRKESQASRQARQQWLRRTVGYDGENCGIPDSDRQRCDGIAILDEQRKKDTEASRSCAIDGMANTNDKRQGQRRSSTTRRQQLEQHASFWDAHRWAACSDGKHRPIPTQPELFPLAPRTAGRVGRLRAYGNGLCAPQATEFIKIAMAYQGGTS